MKLLCPVAVSILVSGCAAAGYQMGAPPRGQASPPSTSREPLVKGSEANRSRSTCLRRWSLALVLQ